MGVSGGDSYYPNRICNLRVYIGGHMNRREFLKVGIGASLLSMFGIGRVQGAESNPKIGTVENIEFRIVREINGKCYEYRYMAVGKLIEVKPVTHSYSWNGALYRTDNQVVVGDI